MLTLKTMCLQEVTRLNMNYEDEDIPLDLQTELKKMKKYCGHFVGDDDDEERKSAITVRYMGARKWQFHFSHTWHTCSDKNCSSALNCRKRKQGVVELLLEEDKEVNSGLLVCQALSSFEQKLIVKWMSRLYHEDMASTVLTVGDEDESDQGSTFSLTTKLPKKRGEGEFTWVRHFRLDHTGSIRSLHMYWASPVSKNVTPYNLQFFESEGIESFLYFAFTFTFVARNCCGFCSRG